MPNRLSTSTLPHIAKVQKPSYAREQLNTAIVHLGIGAFHRAHQAVYTDDINNRENGQWGIVGCSLRSASVKQQLEPQNYLYGVLQKGSDVSLRVIGCIKDVLVGPEDPQAIVEAIAAKTTRIISLTITEKGYCHLPATGELNQQHPDILHDLANLDQPCSAIGYIVAGLQARKLRNLGPLTVMSCDNLPNNGKVAKQVITGFAQLVDAQLAHWIIREVTFPCTMVDRIVPATTAEDIKLCAQQFGFEDQGLVVAEPFSQWVIEDQFCQGRPSWEKAGALLVDDVDVYETMKLRLLNGSHSLLAYCGYLAGCETVYQTMQDPTLKDLCQRFMASAAGTVHVPQGFNIEQYQTQLIERFSNPSLKHRTWQIAMDGSQKIPQRWLNTLRTLLATQQDINLFSFALAAWMRYVTGTDEQGKAIEVSDPLARQFQALWTEHQNRPDAYIEAFFAQPTVFDPDLGQNQALINATTTHFKAMLSNGIKKVMATL